MPRDLCKGVRVCYSAVLKAIVIHPAVAALCMGIPTYFLLSALLYQEALLRYTYGHMVVAPFYVLMTFTAIAWIIEMACIRWILPNLLGICAFCHSAVGSWWLVNLFIVFFSGWSYIPISYMGAVLTALITPAALWLLTGDILRAYRDKMIEEIAQGPQQGTGLASQAQTTGVQDVELGLKPSAYK